LACVNDLVIGSSFDRPIIPRWKSAMAKKRKPRAIKEATGTQIFLPDRNRVHSELSETDAAAISRIVAGVKATTSVNIDETARFWAMLRSVRLAKSVFDFYAKYRSRAKHLRELALVRARAHELTTLLESLSKQVRPSFLLDRNRISLDNCFSTLHMLELEAAATTACIKKVMAFEPDVTFNEWVIGEFLTREWEFLFNSVPKATIDPRGNPGPFIRFVIRVFREMRWPALIAEGARTAMRRYGTKVQRLRRTHALPA
jgi:hypothetical protein